MNEIYTSKETMILPKEIGEVPYSNEVSIGNSEIKFRKLICKMVVYAWYLLLKYKLSFGLCDNLAKVVNYISDTCNLGSNYSESELFNFIYNFQDKTLNKMLKELTIYN